MAKEINKLFRKCARIMGYQYKTFKRWWNDLDPDAKKKQKAILEMIVEKFDEVKAKPIEVDRQGRIINGHARYQALKDFGIPEENIPVEVNDRLSFKSKLKNIKSNGES